MHDRGVALVYEHGPERPRDRDGRGEVAIGGGEGVCCGGRFEEESVWRGRSTGKSWDMG